MTTQATNTVTMFCDTCGDDREFIRGDQEQTISVRGESISVRVPVLTCPTCRNVQPDHTSEIDPLRLAYDEFRRRHKMLTPEQIKCIREQYDLSREAFANVLGMSAATLYRYEGGALQDDLHNNVIFLCDDPTTMQRLVANRLDQLKPLQLRKFEVALTSLVVKRRALQLPETWLSALREAHENPSPLAAHVRALVDDAKKVLGNVPDVRAAYLLQLADVISATKYQECISAPLATWLYGTNSIKWDIFSQGSFSVPFDVRPGTLEWLSAMRPNRGITTQHEEPLLGAIQIRLLRHLQHTFKDLQEDELEASVVDLLSRRFSDPKNVRHSYWTYEHDPVGSIHWNQHHYVRQAKIRSTIRHQEHKE